MPRPKMDPEKLRPRFAAGECTSALAREFDVPCSTVSYWRRRLGFPRTYSPRKFDHALIPVLHAQGLSDRDIADRVGVKAAARVGRIRRGMGLAANGHQSVSFVTKQRAHGLRRKAELKAATGARSLYSLDGERYRQRSRAMAEGYGLPAELLRVETAVVVALAAGPMTATQLARRLGRPGTNPRGYCRFNCAGHAQCPGKNYLTALLRRGLVVRVKRPRRESAYALTALAISMLAGAGKEAGRG